VGDDYFDDGIHVFFVFSRVAPETPTKVAQRISSIHIYIYICVYIALMQAGRYAYVRIWIKYVYEYIYIYIYVYADYNICM